MIRALQRATVVLAASICVTTASASAGRTPAAAADLQLPPLSWTCPMHPEVVEGAAGACPICRMALEPIRLDTTWSCPVHSVVNSDEPGRCRICGRELVRVTVAVSWQCDGQSRSEPGGCADGSPATITYTPRPHGNHNPQHGGAFFMAPDNWHHLEGTLPRAGVFRVYLYDDYSRPLRRDQVTNATGRVATGAGEVPLKVTGGGRYLEASVPAKALPVELTAKLKFRRDAPEHRFDFAFDRYSVEGVATDVVSNPAEAGSHGEDGSHGTTLSGPTLASGSPISVLHAKADLIEAAIARRAYSEIWVPALQAKDAALAIDTGTLDGTARRRVDVVVGRIVRAAWELDAVGDQGDAARIGAAHSKLAAALAELDDLVKR